MRNQLSVVIKKASTAIGAGLLETALEQEGAKGCSPTLCTEPVALEPRYHAFNSSHVLSPAPTSDPRQPLPPPMPVKVVTFEVYPAEEDMLSITWMETILRALTVLRGPLAFELYGTAGRVWVRFAVPEEEVPGFTAALLGHFPALVLRRVDSPFPTSAPSAVNELVPVAPYHRSLTLLGKEGASPLGIAAQALGALGEGHHGVFQVLLCPASPDHDWHFNVENMVEAEIRAAQLCQLGGLSSSFSYDRELPPLLDPRASEKVRVDVGFFATVTRYAVWHTDSDTTASFLQAMRVASGMLRFGNRAWRVLSHDDLVGALGLASVARMVVQRLSHRPGVMLTSREVASLVHIPNARTLEMLSLIQQRTGFPWHPLEDASATGMCLGTNLFAGDARSVEIPMRVRLRHTYVAGTTGSGKSKLVERLAVDDAFKTLGFCVVDPHGDLCMDVLSRLPERRMQDLVYVSFADGASIPRWNPFRAGVPPGKLADDVARAFMAQTASWGARMEHNIRMLSYVVSELAGCLNDFAELASRSARGEALREQALETIRNSQVQRFLRSELPAYTSGELGSVTNKLSRLLLDDSLGAMFSQPENTLHPRRWMDDGKIVLVNLSAGSIGADHARFVGSLLVSLVYRAALSRADLAAATRRPFLLYIDEFQQLQAATLAEILSEGRKYGLGTVLAHQERGQLGRELAQALGNCATTVVFKPSEDDLPYFQRLVGGRLDSEAFRQLGVGQAVVVCGARCASLQTELCPHPMLRDPRVAATRYAARHYAPIGGAPADMATRRPRVYDTFSNSLKEGS